jgi:hypothetical protein
MMRAKVRPGSRVAPRYEGGSRVAPRYEGAC